MKKIKPDIKKTTGQRFREVRQAIKKTQRELGEMLDMKASSITGIEKGKAFPGIPIMLFLMEKFHISPQWIITGQGDMFLNGPPEAGGKVRLQDIYPGIPGDEETAELLYYMQDELVLKNLKLALLEMKLVKYPEYFKKLSFDKEQKNGAHKAGESRETPELQESHSTKKE